MKTWLFLFLLSVAVNLPFNLKPPQSTNHKYMNTIKIWSMWSCSIDECLMKIIEPLNWIVTAKWTSYSTNTDFKCACFFPPVCNVGREPCHRNNPRLARQKYSGPGFTRIICFFIHPLYKAIHFFTPYSSAMNPVQIKTIFKLKEKKQNKTWLIEKLRQFAQLPSL